MCTEALQRGWNLHFIPAASYAWFQQGHNVSWIVNEIYFLHTLASKELAAIFGSFHILPKSKLQPMITCREMQKALEITTSTTATGMNVAEQMQKVAALSSTILLDWMALQLLSTLLQKPTLSLQASCLLFSCCIVDNISLKSLFVRCPPASLTPVVTSTMQDAWIRKLY